MHACCRHQNRFAAALTLGLGLVLLGAVHGLRALGYLDLQGILYFWPTALLVLALVAFAKRGALAFGAHLLLLGAVALQLKDMGHIDWLHRGWPALLVWLGLVQVARSLLRRRDARRALNCENSCERRP